MTTKISTLAAIAAAGLAVGAPIAAQMVVTTTPASAAHEAWRWTHVLLAVFGIVWIVRMTISGIRRRRGEWSRQQWGRFSRQVGSVGAAMLTGLAMARAVDGGLFGVLSGSYHGLYLTVMMVLTLGGAVAFSLVLRRFAKGP